MVCAAGFTGCFSDGSGVDKPDNTPDDTTNVEEVPYEISGGDGGVAILGYKGKEITGTLEIPATVWGKKVIAIGEGAFADDMGGMTGITKVVIPNTVAEIHKGAFKNNDYLTEVEIVDREGAESELTTIWYEAFANIKNLKSFTLPASVGAIDDRAFEGSGITEFICKGSAYSWINDLLVLNAVSDVSNKFAIYANPEATEITVPDYVGTIGSYVFYNNKKIKTVNLNDVRFIGVYAFANSTLEVLIGAENLENADLRCFENTPWLKSQNKEYFIQGNVLVAYYGSDENVTVPDNIVRIGERAFAGSEVKTVILPDGIESIGREAFADCESLEWVLINANIPPMLDGDCFPEGTAVYVKGTVYNEYKHNIIFSITVPTLATKKIKVEFYGADNEFLGETEEEYYTTFDHYITAPQIKGHDFKYWVTEDGGKLSVKEIIKYYEDVKLTAYYEPWKTEQ